MKQDFEPGRWIERLATSLLALAPRVRPTVPNEWIDDLGHIHGHNRLVSYEEYRGLARRARQEADAEVVFEGSHIWIDDDPTDVIAVLCEHPVISQALGHSGKAQAVHFLRPYGVFRVKLKTLALSLTKLAIKTDGRNAAQTLQRFLTLGEARELKAYEVTLFYGLKLDRRLDIGEGAFLAPYEEARAFSGEFPFLAFKHHPMGIEQHHPLDDAPKSIAALVRELTWGPAITSTEVELERSLTTRFQFSIYEEPIEDPSFTFQFPKAHEAVRDFLCVATGEQLVSRYQYVRVDRWMGGTGPQR